MKLTPEEAQAWRERIKRQWDEYFDNLVVIPIDDAIEFLEEVCNGTEPERPAHHG